MSDRHEGPSQHRAAHDRTGWVLGWASGLALLVAPWIVAGVLATVATMVRPDGWEAESTFPWLLLVAFMVGLGWVIYGSVRIRGFRRGAIPGTAVALTVIAGIYLLGLALR